MKEAISKAPERRVRRTPLGRRNALTVSGKDPSCVYRIVNDTGDRIHRFLEAGYEIEEASAVVVGDARIGKVSPPGSKAEVSVGQGQKAFVMKQKREYYEEDQAAKQAHINATEEATRQKALDGTYGKLEISRS